MFPGPLGLSLAGKALAEGKWALDTIDIRDFATDKHRSVDDTPAGGGAGMVMRADIAARCHRRRPRRRRPAGTPTLYLSPRGATAHPGPRARARRGPGADTALRPLRGHRPAGASRRATSRKFHRRLRAVRRRARGDGADRRRACACCPAWPATTPRSPRRASSGLLEYPQYTRPRDLEGLAIPEVLLSGDHEQIAEWRREQAEKLTRERRPDLWRGTARTNLIEVEMVRIACQRRIAACTAALLPASAQAQVAMDHLLGKYASTDDYYIEDTAEFEIPRGVIDGPNLLCIFGTPKEAGPGKEALGGQMHAEERGASRHSDLRPGRQGRSYQDEAAGDCRVAHDLPLQMRGWGLGRPN